MRKITVTAAAAALLAAGLQAPAWAAEAPPAPTDVTLSWSNGKVKLTWKDNGEANNVSASYPDLNDGGIKVELQARAKSTDAWKTCGRYAGNTTTAFDTGIASLGNREYRLFVPARKVVSGNVIVLTPAASTSAKSSKTMIKFVSKGFTPAHPARHARVDITAKIQPAATVRGTLQVLLKGKWNNVFALPFRNGALLMHANVGNDVGSFSYRIALPAVTVNGLTLTSTTSSPFPITIG